MHVACPVGSACCCGPDEAARTEHWTLILGAEKLLQRESEPCFSLHGWLLNSRFLFGLLLAAAWFDDCARSLHHHGLLQARNSKNRGLGV